MDKNGRAYYLKHCCFYIWGKHGSPPHPLKMKNMPEGKRKQGAHTSTAISTTQCKGLTTITSFHEGWSYTLTLPGVLTRNTKLQLISSPVGQFTYPAPSCSSQGCSNKWGVTLIWEAGETSCCIAKTELHYLQHSGNTKPSDTNEFSLSIHIETTIGISNINNLNLKAICYFKVFTDI